MSIINADSASLADVQDAVDAAQTGDTVVIPAGTPTWAGGVGVGGKNITIQGAGSMSTVITAGTDYVFDLGDTSSRITALGINTSGPDNLIHMSKADWRIDHCRFNNTSGANRVAVFCRGTSTEIAAPKGLIDQNTFINCRVDIVGDAQMLDEGWTQHELWATILGLGTYNAVYIEDNVFDYSIGNHNCCDGNYGARYVFRHNTVYNSYCEAHSVQGNHRAQRSWEIYENVFDSDDAIWVGGFLRGGTGVMFNNTFTGTWGDSPVHVNLDNVRCFTSFGFPPGTCDGSSAWDQNTPGEAGWRGRDQIGTGGDQSLWTAGNLYPSQVVAPAYFWNNKHGLSDIVIAISNGCDDWIVNGRDFYANTQHPSYTPYTYPHPMRGEGSGVIVSVGALDGRGTLLVPSVQSLGVMPHGIRLRF